MGATGKSIRVHVRGPDRDPPPVVPGLGPLLALVAHEIQNPISYLLGSLRALQELVDPLGETLERYRASCIGEPPEAIARAEEKLRLAGGSADLPSLVADSLEGAERIRGLARDLVTLTRSHAGAVPIDVNEVLGATVRLVSRAACPRARLDLDLRATEPVEADAARLGQVFLNLVTNAIEACEPPDPSRHRIAVRSRDVRRGVRIDIDDTGCGLPPGGGRRIFEPFYTRRPDGGGTGLGLYVCRRIVEDHRGVIGYRRRAGGGTGFVVILPPSQAGPASAR